MLGCSGQSVRPLNTSGVVWGSLAVGGAQLSYVKPCGRCKVTTIDQEIAEEGWEPLKTLGQFR
jgi:uncharacterized protein YcbX